MPIIILILLILWLGFGLSFFHAVGAVAVGLGVIALLVTMLHD